MKRILLTLITSLGLASAAVAAAEGSIAWDKAPVNIKDEASLQHGAKLFVNYCLSCHSAAFMRYNRMRDIGLTEEQIKSNLMFTTDNVGDTMVSAINPEEAKEWFGKNPPDLTLIARSRAGSAGSGADYLYTLLRSYYRDPAKPTGWDNLAYPNIGMPHILWELQGERRPLFEEAQSHGETVKVFKGWEQVSPGQLSEAEYDAAVADLVTFLQWMGEPAQLTRQRIGIWVLAFLLMAIFVTWQLNKAFWRDVK
ncbi:cytochrome c1 [Corticibacter populi]|uniref:Cytochrome c1 n=1 Tax=Corticibacter populi TaxID=1550736 RepID=A0A3M6R0P2_9BURK|nr:cytochrome c1 [Corticibacter populi]RMX08826.1 cytochrome c1 [Corticibacter populi]